MNELTILDFALGIALLYHWGADGKEIRGTRITGLKQGFGILLAVNDEDSYGG